MIGAGWYCFVPSSKTIMREAQWGEEMSIKSILRAYTLTGSWLVFASIGSCGALAEGDQSSAQAGRECTNPSAAASGFPQPEIRQSSFFGILKTTLHGCIAKNTIVDQPSGEARAIYTPTYEGTIPGPTLLVRPGDKLSIDMVNDLPANPDLPRKGFFPHDQYTLNLHTHGLTVSPLGISDNIYRRMKPGTTNLIQVDIPADHPSGTFWYHTHKHGSVTYQFLGGMAGVLSVNGGPGTLDTVSGVPAAKDVPMAF